MREITTTRTSKDSLARLLAQEDLVIEHRKVPTAYFELKKRKLVCPILKDDMSADLYDLFMGHEVGHALNTPEDGWHTAVCEKGMKYKGYLNVLEDIRIEKAIKNKYAGLRRSFYDAYKELYNDIDFFGVKTKDVNKLAFIDRINLYFKVGHTMMVDFSKEELKIIEALHRMDTWEKVVKMADYLYELSKFEEVEPQEDPNQNMVPQFDNEDGMEMPEGDEEYSVPQSSGEDKEENETTGTGEEKSDEDGEEGSGEEGEEGEDDSESNSGEKGEEGKEKEQESSKEFGDGAGSEEDNANESITDKASREKEKDFLHDDLDNKWGGDNSYLDLNTKQIKWEDHKVGYKTILEEMKEGWAKQEENGYKKQEWNNDTDSWEYIDFGDTDDAERYTNEFIDHNQKIVNYMAKEFDMRKAASNYKKAMTAKSGEIDMQKIYQYLIKDDIFKKVTVVPDGKNHGMILLLDWSGSMHDCIKETFEQCAILVMFCRRVGIPHRVYAFSDAYGKSDVSEEDRKEYYEIQKGKTERNEVTIGRTAMLELFSDKMNNKDFKEMLTTMMIQVDSMTYYNHNQEAPFRNPYNQVYRFNLGGTPLDESLLIIRDYIQEFKNNYNIDKLQFVTLTDGDSFHARGLTYNNGREYFFHDKKVKKTYEYNTERYYSRYSEKAKGGSTDCLLKWIEDTTGVDTVGFFICKQSYREFDKYSEKFSKLDIDYSDQWDKNKEDFKLFRKEGGIKLECGEASGYKEFYMLNKKKMSIVVEDDTLNVEEGASKQKLKGAMMRMGKNKMSQRKILQHFIKKVA